jgi:hypothetical protein
MEPLIQYVVAASASITALGAVGAAGYARKGFYEARASHRILTGEDDVEGDHGVVGRLDGVEDEVAAAEEEIDELRERLTRLRARLERSDVLEEP